MPPPFKKLRQCTSSLDIMKSVKSSELAKKLGMFGEQLTVNVDLIGHANDYKLGAFPVSVRGVTELVCTDPMYLYFKSFSSDCLLVWNEFNDDFVLREAFCNATCKVPCDVLLSLKDSNAFRIVLHRQNIKLLSGTIVLHVYAVENVFLSLDSASEPRFTRSKETLSKVMKYFKRIECVYFKEPVTAEEDVKIIFDNIQNCYDPLKKVHISHAYLIPRLREYQSQAVQWMLEREQARTESEIHPLYTAVQLKNGAIYYQKYGGFFVKDKYTRRKPKGGILADEMGLGKTLEILALILKNPMSAEIRNQTFYYDKMESRSSDADLYRRMQEFDSSFCSMASMYFKCVCGSDYKVPDAKVMVQCKSCLLIQHAECILAEIPSRIDAYLCPHCWVDTSEHIKPSPATLIICPSAILYQWEQEISKHIKKHSLDVFVYLGVEHHKFIIPDNLGNHDVVLTSYEILRQELKHVNVPHGESRRVLRYPQKFSVIPSPLSAVRWWRVCLDEAQMVESVTSKISEMALELQTFNRWCVTGTPIQKSIRDIYGLLLFLKYDPYDKKEWWNDLLWKPFLNGKTDPLVSLLNQILWRTSKKSVLHQIEIPPQQTIVHKLKFSQVENFFYQNEREKCKNDFIANIGSYDCFAHDVLSSMNKHVISKILLPLRKLQRACCHFQLVRDSFLDIQKCNVSMSDLLTQLLQRSQKECEEAHRGLIHAMNGLAGIYAIKEDYERACEMYQKILKSVEENEAFFRTDALQQIHAMHNFNEVILLKTSKMVNISEVSETLKNVEEESFKQEDLKAKCDLLCEKYLRKSRMAIRSCQKNLHRVRREFREAFANFKCGRNRFQTSSWWFDTILSLPEKDCKIFMRKLTDVLLKATAGCHVEGITSVAHQFHDECGLYYIIQRLSQDFYNSRLILVRAIRRIAFIPNVDNINRAINCHLRPTRVGEEKCLYCKADEALNKYECNLYRFEETPAVMSEPSICFAKRRQGNHADSEYELILKFFVNHSRHIRGLSACFEDGMNELKLLDIMKKEFKIFESVWVKSSEYVAAVDELQMAKMSMRLLFPGEPVPDPPVSYIVLPGQVNSHELQLQSDIISSELVLKRKLGQLHYLQNLRKAEDSNQPVIQCCPVCDGKLTDTWCVLHCGHCFCLPCVQLLCKYAETSADLSCPICRSQTPKSDLYYVDLQAAESEEDISIKGRYSTKIHGIVRCLIQIKRNDSSAKSIVFSSWPDFLLILEKALVENGVKCLCFMDRNKYEVMATFKKSRDKNVLLLPLKIGGNGLNIIEATNVIIAEPLLDNSQLLQAIGRVDRIGQKKSTTVHMFLIADTVEEHIFNIQNAAASSSNASSSNAASSSSAASSSAASSSSGATQTLSTLNDLKKLFE